jgi:hypothetical protein
MTTPRKTTKAEIKSVALLIRESATEIAIAMIRSGQWEVNGPGSRIEDLAVLAVAVASEIALQSFQIAPIVIDGVERNITEELKD